MADAQAPTMTAHEAAMVAKVDSVYPPGGAEVAPVVANTAPPTKAERPSYVPEKFWNAEAGAPNLEAWAKSYGELEKAHSTPEAKAPDATEAAAPEAPTKVSMDALQEEFTANGALSEASYKSLESLGFDKATVDDIIQARVVAAEAYANRAFEAAGGKDAYSAMLEWAKTNLPQAEQDAFNDAIGKPAALKSAVLGLRAQYAAAQGSEPSLAQGASGQTGVIPFASRAEVTQAMRDPRYSRDPAYRSDVERRLDAMAVF